MEKVGLKIVELAHAITQKGYTIALCKDFEGSMTVMYKEKRITVHHDHCGFPGCERIQLEKAIIKSLNEFLKGVESV